MNSIEISFKSNTENNKINVCIRPLFENHKVVWFVNAKSNFGKPEPNINQHSHDESLSKGKIRKLCVLFFFTKISRDESL